MVLRCGVERPASLVATSDLLSVDGLDWFVEKQADGYLMTLVHRAVRVEVRVPSAYSPEVNPLVDLAPAIAAALPRAGTL